MKLGKLTEGFIADVCAGKNNETERSYRAKLNYLISYLGAATPGERITLETLNRFRRYLQTRTTSLRGTRLEKKPLSPFTIRTVLVTVRHFCRWCYQTHHISNDPTIGFRIPQPPEPDPKPISTEMVIGMLKAAATTGDRRERERNIAIICLLRDTGGRIGSLASAHIGDLDLKRRRLHVHDKGNKRRILHLSPNTCRALAAYLVTRDKFNPADDYLFIGKGGRGLKREAIYQVLKRLAERTGIEGRFNPHSFRHAWARDAIEKGCDLSQVSQILGHSSVAITAQYYARWNDEELHEIHSRVSPGADLPDIAVSED